MKQKGLSYLIVGPFAIGKKIGELAQLCNGFLKKPVELVFQRGIALGQRGIVHALGLHQDFLLLASDLLKLTALALHLALHAAHTGGHRGALGIL